MPVQMVVIGGSAGSLEVILKVLPDLRTDLSFPILLVLHRKSATPTGIEPLLSHRTRLKVSEIEDKMPAVAGQLYIAPVDYHVFIERDQTFSLDLGEKIHYSRPSIDVTLESACDIYGSQMCGILLSGANADGAAGIQCIAKRHAIVAIQDPESCLVDVMPIAADRLVSGIQRLLPDRIAEFINSLN